jgi:hypothetical protein
LSLCSQKSLFEPEVRHAPKAAAETPMSYLQEGGQELHSGVSLLQRTLSHCRFG